MLNRSKTHLSAASLEILGYLERHPRACDDLIGIARWWLLRQRIETTTREAKDALDELVAKGFLLRTTRPHCQPLYSMNDQKLSQVRTLLTTKNKTQHNKQRKET